MPPKNRFVAPGDTVELQGYFRAADGYFAADQRELRDVPT
jgi:hypothetical protein